MTERHHCAAPSYPLIGRAGFTEYFDKVIPTLPPNRYTGKAELTKRSDRSSDVSDLVKNKTPLCPDVYVQYLKKEGVAIDNVDGSFHLQEQVLIFISCAK